MDNQELKLKFEEIKNKIEAGRKNNEDVTELLKVKYNLLKEGFSKIKTETQSEKYDKNPRKYSTLLSYVNSMKEIAKEIKLSLDETASLENDVISEMKKNGLDWLLNEQ